MVPWQDVALLALGLVALVVLFRLPFWLIDRMADEDAIRRGYQRMHDEQFPNRVEEGTRCPQCGTVNDEGYQYCRECVARIGG